MPSFQHPTYSHFEDFGGVVIVIVTGGKTESTPSLFDLARTGV